jgi:hypothetical protein
MPDTQQSPLSGAPGHVSEEAPSAHCDGLGIPAKLKRRKTFQPCPVETGDEFYANGIFEFNITRLTALVDAHPGIFPVESIAVTDIPDYGSSRLNEDTIRTADLSRPILMAEIAPGLYNLIDGQHRVAKARRDSVPTVPVRRVACPAHVPFLTSAMAYEKYVEYWNSKLKDMSHRPASGFSRHT